MARILVCGTLAYDDIGAFATPLSAGSRNVKLDRLDRSFGGCAMNVAYNLAGLGHQPVPFVYVGDDYAGGYARHVAAAGISEAGMFRIAGACCARGIVLTGSDGAQFTAFYPGPSGLDRWATDLDAVLAEGAFDAAILAPDLPAKMRGCASRLAAVPLVVWCPGQYAELLGRTDIEPVLDVCRLLVMNRHEWQALTTRMPATDIFQRPVDVIVTDGAGPVTLLPEATAVPVPPVANPGAADPTGCGDAFVAATTSALLAGQPPRQAVTAGVRLAADCLRQRGAQAHPVAGSG